MYHSPRRPQQCTTPGAGSVSNRVISAAHGAAAGVGAILSQLASAAAQGSGTPGAKAWATLSRDAIPEALSCVASAVGHPVTLLHLAACAAVGRVGALCSLPMQSRGIAEAGGSTGADLEGTCTSGGGGRKGSDVAIFERLWAACKLGETGDASRRAEAAVEAVGRCCRGIRRRLGADADDQRSNGPIDDGASVIVRYTLGVLLDLAETQVRVRLEIRCGRSRSRSLSASQCSRSTVSGEVFFTWQTSRHQMCPMRC